MDNEHKASTPPPESFGILSNANISNMSITSIKATHFQLGDISIDLQTGDIKLPEGKDISEEAKLFWSELSKLIKGEWL